MADASETRPLPLAFFDRPVDRVARDLIGAVLTFDGVGGRIVETESYDPADPASHSYGERQSRRNRTMFGPPAHAYVYRIYGMYECLNFVCRRCEAVLIRALEPLHGIDVMRARRGTENATKLCAGPGRLCQALAITLEHDGLSLLAPPFSLAARSGRLALHRGTRIGITKAADAERRFGLAGSRYLSHPFGAESKPARRKGTRT
jgi:DNA-3-methyladenine glycosylase